MRTLNSAKKLIVLNDQQPASYQIIRSSRKTIGLYVFPNGEIVVRSPKRCSDKEIAHYIAEREQWIVKTLLKFSQHPGRLELKYVDGEEHAFLGELFPIQIATSSSRSILFEEGAFHCTVLPNDGSVHVRALLMDWYRQQSFTLFSHRLDFCFQAFDGIEIKKPNLKVRVMKARWGSCSAQGEVTLNLELVKHPIHVIDYVITHELCHLLEFNHSPRFYRLLSQAIPQWKDAKSDLEKGVALYGAF